MNKLLLWIMSFGTGLTAATIYLTQPLLEILRQQFNCSISEAGLIVTFTQIGYALGILFLIPLGDVTNKKLLIQTKLVIVVLVLFIAGIAQSLPMFFFASLALGIFASAAQDFVPLAADLAPEGERGKILGSVMSGLLIGILLSRTFSGLIAHQFGWRLVFFSCTALVLLLLFLTALLVPSHPPKIQLHYTKLMRSMGRIFMENRLLQLSILTQGVLGLAFSAFWTVLTFELSVTPFQLSTASIGLFGLAGAAGALAAPIAGKISDNIGPLYNIKFGISTVFISFSLLFAFQNSLEILIIATILFDLGVQVCLITHQTIIYAMHPEARARINSLFVTGLFIFFSLGSFLGSLVFSAHGWVGLIYLALICCLLSFLTHLLLTHHYKKLCPIPN